ncbi:Iduronate 2-sulfatase [Eumeta japonica]|uniref:Iduronate 2-sulfatase n=1 Tax=Eumeta variegata TaxID=151549 RepID=A0A4C1WDN1_EUMVA|nr:Iduronate 2-sulfatase [Eumeta japonica]
MKEGLESIEPAHCKIRRQFRAAEFYDLRHLSDEIVHLPNINKLAGKGIFFKNTFAQQALCAPSRNSILTGRRPDTLHLYDFYNYWRETVGNFTTLPQLLKNHGYETYSVGKVFHPGKSSNFSDDYPYSWSDYPYHPSTEQYKNAAVCKDEGTNILQRNLICPVDVDNQPEQTLPDIQTSQYAINFLLNKKNKRIPGF